MIYESAVSWVLVITDFQHKGGIRNATNTDTEKLFSQGTDLIYQHRTAASQRPEAKQPLSILRHSGGSVFPPSVGAYSKNLLLYGLGSRYNFTPL